MIALYMHLYPQFPDGDTMEKDLLAFAKSKKVTWYRDESENFEDRPTFDQMMADVRAGKIQKVVVWRLDQVGGSGPGLVKLLDELRDLGVGFMSMKESINL